MRFTATAWTCVLLLASALAGCGDGDRGERGTRLPPAGDGEGRPGILVSGAGAAERELTDRATIIRLQERLRALGVYAGPADGGHAHETVVALREFQAARGLPTSGKLDPPTADALGLAWTDVQRVSGHGGEPGVGPGGAAPGGPAGARGVALDAAPGPGARGAPETAAPPPPGPGELLGPAGGAGGVPGVGDAPLPPTGGGPGQGGAPRPPPSPGAEPKPGV